MLWISGKLCLKFAFFSIHLLAQTSIKTRMSTAVENKHSSLKKDILAKRLKPVYLLQGEEPYFIDSIADCIEKNALSEAEKSFNQTIIYGKDTNFESVVLAAKRFPMMANHQVIIVKEAQHIKDIDALEPYLESPLESTILVICLKGKKLDKRKKVSKLFSKYEVFDSDKLRDYQLGAWVKSYVSKLGKQIDEEAVQMICDYLGTDLAKIATEIEKMLINTKDVPFISLKHIEENIGISKDYNIFELQKALGARNFNKSIQIVNYFAADIKNHPMPLICPNLFGYFNKLMIYMQNKNKPEMELASLMGINKFFLRDYASASMNYTMESLENIIGVIRFYELRAKGVDNLSTSNSHSQLLIEMTVRILKC